MLLSELIRSKLRYLEWTVSDLSAKTGIPINTLNRYLDGAIPDDKDLTVLVNVLKLDPDNICLDELNISVSEAAAIMRKNPSFVRAMVTNGVFGWTNGKSYHIPRKAFYKYMGLTDDVDVQRVASALYYLIESEVKKRDRRKRD